MSFKNERKEARHIYTYDVYEKHTLKQINNLKFITKQEILEFKINELKYS